MMLPKLKYIAIFVSGAVCAAESVIDPYGPSQGDFGGVGLLQMPTARMAKTGEFSDFGYQFGETAAGQYRCAQNSRFYR